jgi:hypothetical protein
MSYWVVGIAVMTMSASSIQPIGLRGRRAASKVPTAAAGTRLPAVMNASATDPPTGW